MKRILPLLILLLAACTPAATPLTATENFVAAEEPTTTVRVTATATEGAPLETDLTKSACMSAGGEIESYEIESDYLDAGLRFRVYAPPCYAEQPERNFPVLYLIHGQTYNDDQWDRLGADEGADELIASGEVAPFLIVMPYNISSAQPAVDKFGEAVIEELLPWVEENYRTLAEREYRAVGGLSRGASWAIHFGLTHPELFGAMAGHSPPVFVEDAPQVRGWLDEIPAELMPRIWLDIGERDQEAIMSSAIWFEGLLTERNIAHEWYLFSGYHDEAYWSSHVEMYLRWYAADW
jgi:enterochelin esterase-like enzyme